MDSEPAFLRSPELMNVGDSLLVVVDVQDKLLPVIDRSESVLWNVGRLVDGARIASVPIIATEQYPEGLGGTVDSLKTKLESAETPCFAKTSFSCWGSEEFRFLIREQSPAKILVCGIETHVCVFQTAMDLISEGFRVQIAIDAVGARGEIDHATALRRLECEGGTLTTTETALFEWCQTSKTPTFKQLQRLVMKKDPNSST